jgi:2-oxoglutarate dehydrogenase E1 component
VIWEGQFGDFANGAQIIIDQYIAASEMKWGYCSNLTLLLPHGYEGMGPEHSSARIERFLQLCGDENLLVANCSTPAQLFHILRRQVKRTLLKPLVLFTPKALLRHPLCRSPFNAFTEGQFEEVILDENSLRSPKRFLFCSGKIYYDLIQHRDKHGAGDVIIRIEQLYPLHEEKIRAAIAQYTGVSQAIWVQEEHENMGAYTFIRPKLEQILGAIPLSYVGRSLAASPAAGSSALHKWELNTLLNQLYKGIES